MLLAKQHRAGLQIGYSPFCKADSAEVSALTRRPAAVDFAPLALHPELENLCIDELPWETTEIKNVEQLYAIPKLKNLSIWDKQMPPAGRFALHRFGTAASQPRRPQTHHQHRQGGGLEASEPVFLQRQRFNRIHQPEKPYQHRFSQPRHRQPERLGTNAAAGRLGADGYAQPERRFAYRRTAHPKPPAQTAQPMLPKKFQADQERFRALCIQQWQARQAE